MWALLEGFYKVRFQVNDAVGRSVMYVHGGSMLGGNSAFAHYGTYSETGGVVTSEITSHRHNDDPNYVSLLGSDIAKIDVEGGADADGKIYRFVGGSPQMPGAVFRSVMTPIDNEITPHRSKRWARAVSSTGFILSTSGCSTASPAASPG